MLGRLSLLGAVMLTLSLGLFNYQPVSATDAAVEASRPAVSELEAALKQLRAIGEYEYWFGDTDLPLTAEETSFYEEYNYLHRLVTDTQALITHYDDAAYLEQHQLQPSIFQDVLDEAHDALRGLPLLLGLERKAPVASTTPSISTPATSIPVSTGKVTPSTPATITIVNPTVAAAPATSQPASVTTPANTTPSEPAEVAKDTTADITDIATDDIAVPATGETAEDKRQISWPALIAVTVTGAAVASIVIALIIRQEPRRSGARRRRH